MSADRADGPGEQVSAIAVLAFLDEVALLAVLALAGARLGGSRPARIGLAIGLPLLVAVLWGRWLAPRASRRLDHPTRMVAKLVLVAMAAGLLGVSGSAVLALAFLVVSAIVVVAGEVMDATR